MAEITSGTMLSEIERMKGKAAIYEVLGHNEAWGIYNISLEQIAKIIEKPVDSLIKEFNDFPNISQR